MKRSFSFFLAVLIGWGAVTQPARAFAPPLIYAAYMTANVSGATYSLAALAGAIGIAGMYLTIKDTQDNGVRIPVGPNTSNQPPEPAAAATSATTSVYTGGGQTSSNFSTVCSAAVSYRNSQEVESNWGMGLGKNVYEVKSAVAPNCIAHYDWYRTADNYKSPGGDINISVGQVPGCSSGYTLSGGACTLSNPRQATDDKVCDILVSNGQFSTADDMNCPSAVDGSKLSPMLRDGKAIAYGTNSSGQPLMWEVTPGPQNYIVREYQQVQTATQTQIKTTTAMVDTATSAVTSVQTSTSPGSMSSPSAASAPTVTTTADPTTVTNTPTITQDQTKPADQQTCGLPGTPACAIDDTQFDGKDNFTTPRNSEINDKLDQNKTQLENSKTSTPTIAFDWLPSLMPGNATACAPLIFDFTLHNRITGTLSAPNIQLDICDKLDLVRAILGYMLGMWTVWYVWRRFTTANQGA